MSVKTDRWNEAAMADNTAAVLEAVKADNVVLFPVVARPFSDGRPA
ncbi:MAG: hypothetical protein K8H74_18015 [Notoacmeibacter sp.]|nr:hypothetical protein [Notoacmeibacter sp.]